MPFQIMFENFHENRQIRQSLFEKTYSSIILLSWNKNKKLPSKKQTGAIYLILKPMLDLLSDFPALKWGT